MRLMKAKMLKRGQTTPIIKRPADKPGALCVSHDGFQRVTGIKTPRNRPGYGVFCKTIQQWQQRDRVI
ncbi:hypothetical protein TH25_21360 [Thalassospira profundimaris]|uniref:Uncharacterized protein n=1 Tax=Thalassospira profundimaris TaxID=502049 RepID=A0A367WPR4_9PROT|nr:hypothetical protein TH25_21360 [Thalassospira profundimaris]